MLQISRAQMHIFDSQVEMNFARRLGAELMKFFPYCFGPDRCGVPAEFALSCIRHAKILGLRREESVSRYANLATLLGLGFENTTFAINARLTPESAELLDPAWLDRIVPIVAQMLRERH